jgi:hypothetical protein
MFWNHRPLTGFFVNQLSKIEDFRCQCSAQPLAAGGGQFDQK